MLEAFRKLSSSLKRKKVPQFIYLSDIKKIDGGHQAHHFDVKRGCVSSGVTAISFFTAEPNNVSWTVTEDIRYFSFIVDAPRTSYLRNDKEQVSGLTVLQAATMMAGMIEMRKLHGCVFGPRGEDDFEETGTLSLQTLMKKMKRGEVFQGHDPDRPQKTQEQKRALEPTLGE